MSMNQLQPELLKLLALEQGKQDIIIKRLERLYGDFGALNINKWRNASNKKNSLLHELVEKEMPDVLRYLVLERKFDVNVRRDSDGLTPLQLALENHSSEMRDVLQEVGADDIQSEDVSTWLSEEDKKKSMNIVWMDLEMTSIKNPEIMECAVIITDKDLHELAKANWVIHFEQSVLDTLEDWHQKTFADVDNEGNGLFADVLKSKLTNDQVEEELLSLIKRHCPPNQCPLAGSSIHTDKLVLQKCMPKVHDYLHYRIIDVTSFQSIMKRWIPDVEMKIKRRIAASGQQTVNHRAMDDIKWSISFMKQLRKTMDKLQDDRPQGHSPSVLHHHPRGAPNHHPRGAPNHYPRGAPNHHPRAASNDYPQGASNNEYKRDISGSQSDDDSDLPSLSSNIDTTGLYTDERRLMERIEIEKTFDVKRLRLNEKWLPMYYANPHLREVFMNKRWIEKYDKDFTKDNRVLLSPTQQARNGANLNQKKYSTTEHWGQRKLLLTEIEFLTKYATDDSYTVIYAGAAPGSHINHLSSLFPSTDFILIDDKEFSVKSTNKIKTKEEKFTRELAKHYSNSEHKIIFICNVHTFRAQEDGQNDVTEDMENQLEWYKLLKPQAALLNFRLPRQPGKVLYLKGHLIIEPWASRRPMECRLVVKKDAKMIDYNYQDFEDNLHYFQNVTRVMYYKHNMDDVENEGFDHCYDCRAEIFILQEYLTKVQNVKGDNNLKTSIAVMSREISKHIEDKKRPQILKVPRTLAVIPKKATVFSTDV